MDRHLGIDSGLGLMYGKCKMHTKKGAEKVDYFTTDIMKDMTRLIDLHIESNMLLQDIDPTNPLCNENFPIMDYKSPGNDKGVTVLLGGDHGMGAFRMHMKLNLSSPYARKKDGNLSYQCPMIQIGYIGCSKDNYDLLDKTIMKDLRPQVKKLQNSSVVLVHNGKRQKDGSIKDMTVWETYIIERETDINHLHLQDDKQMIVQCRDEATIMIDFSKSDKLRDIEIKNLRADVVVTNFYTRYIGDLQFLATLCGMTNSETCYCVICELGSHDFNCDCTKWSNSIRTQKKLKEALDKFEELKKRRKDTNITRLYVHLSIRSIL